MGAVVLGQWPALRFLSPLIEPDVPISGHPALRLASPQGPQRRRSGQAFQTQHAMVPMDHSALPPCEL
jgi:hypothetical protein